LHTASTSRLILPLLLALLSAGCSDVQETQVPAQSSGQGERIAAQRVQLGVAKLREDGVLEISLSRDLDGNSVHGYFVLPPEDPRYAREREHLGEMVPGREVPYFANCEKDLARTADRVLVQGGQWTLESSEGGAQDIQRLQETGRDGLARCGGADLKLEFPDAVFGTSRTLGELELSALFNDPGRFQSALARHASSLDAEGKVRVLEYAAIFGGPEVRRAAARTFRELLADPRVAESIQLAAAGNVFNACDALRDVMAESSQGPDPEGQWVSLEKYMTGRGIKLESCRLGR
jgi:hypothetical protein